jgi:hypothetical protein
MALARPEKAAPPMAAQGLRAWAEHRKAEHRKAGPQASAGAQQRAEVPAALASVLASADCLRAGVRRANREAPMLVRRRLPARRT